MIACCNLQQMYLEDQMMYSKQIILDPLRTNVSSTWRRHDVLHHDYVLEVILIKGVSVVIDLDASIDSARRLLLTSLLLFAM